MKVPNGCAICQATWGNHWAEVEGQRMFFCCEICEGEFRNMLSEVKQRTGWKTIDEIRMSGDQRRRECVALSSAHSYRFLIGFNSEGGISMFHELGKA